MNRFCRAIFLAALVPVFFCQVQLRAQMPFMFVPGGPPAVAWWKFDDGSGSSAVDSSGGGYTLTTYNSPTWGTGHIGGDLSFSAGSSQYAYIASCPVQAPPFTVVGWIKAGSSGVIWCMNSSFTIYHWDGWYGEASAGTYKVNAVANPDQFGTAATQTGATGTYIHYAATVDGSGNGRVYINGSAGSSQAFGQTPSAGSYQFTIGGSYQSGPGNYTTMSADHWKIYNRVLSGAEIAALAAQ